MRVLHTLTLTVAALLLGACGSHSVSDGSTGIGPTDPTTGNLAGPYTPPATFHPLFQLAQGMLPYPTDLFLNDSVDGTLNQPLVPFEPNAVSMNALDGFGTNSDITVRFSAPIDPTSLANPGAVTVLETQMLTLTTGTTVARVPIGVRRPLIPGVDYKAYLSTAVDAGGEVLTIEPLKPLTASTGGAVLNPLSPPPGLPPGSLDASGVGYLVIITAAVRAADGSPAQPDTDYATIKTAIGMPNPANPSAGCATLTDPTLHGTCQLTAPHLLIAAGAGIPLGAVALTFSFTTQSTRDTLVQMATAIQNATTPAPLVAQALPNGKGGILTTKDLLDPAGTNPLVHGIADVYEGTITLPYYLPTPADATTADPEPPVTGQWLSATPVSLVAGQTGSNYITRYNPIPAPRHVLPIPVLITIPNAAGPKPAAGWPVVIFVHGITRNRADALAVAEGYASVGIAVAAIDLPLHGITPTDRAAALRIPGVAERTFDVDYVNNATDQPPADGQIDGSGANFIQLTSPITSRDDLRQGVIDELTLASALPAATIVVGTTPVPMAFDGSKIALAGQSLGAIIGTTVASLPSNLKSFGLSVPGGTIDHLLLDSATFGPPISAAVGSQLGDNTLLYQVFQRDAQAAVDAGDPINHIGFAAANHAPILLHKVLNDQVVPNNATDRLIAAGGLLKANAAGLWPAGSYVTFTQGTHGSLLDPTAAPAVTVEMQREFVGFALSGGAGFQIFDASNVEP